MSLTNIEHLRSIKTLPSLIVYLRDELNWPIGSDMVEDDLTFEYSPEELGFPSDQAARIKEIKQLRPMEINQPWGIFWINFEKKRLPVVMLRRILGHLVIRKRALANRSTQRAWQMSDLLFISAYGEDSDRAITFAHFAQETKNSNNLPVLKVLGWDDGDTVLHLADAHRILSEKLRWPDNTNDTKSWRNLWVSAFTLRYKEVVETTQELEEELARLAIVIRKRANSILSKESERGPLRNLFSVFKKTLIHDLTLEDFADVIAQTISYGLLAARLTSSSKISVQNLVEMMPATNPFLRDLLSSFLSVTGRGGNFDFDELGVQEVVELLNRANVDAVKRDFGNRTRDEDPVIHFYEHFLKAYDPEKKVKRGVFFTPQPVVSYIVRSAHELLQTEFGLEDGLASTITWGEIAERNKDLKIPKHTKPEDHFVTILDPATGTATFLVEVIDVIYRFLKEKWEKRGIPEVQQHSMWNAYVSKHLLPRLFGYELMMAPYVIAHLKIGIKLAETGYKFDSNERARIFLTNALEPPIEQIRLENIIPALAHEAQVVNEIKREQSFTVVIGNPPYSGISANMQPEIRQMINPYRHVDNQPIKEKGALQFEKNLNDDYVKFIRFAESKVESSIGVIGLITNNVYLESATLRGLRSHLLNTFSYLWFLDLHGDADKRETVADGKPDKNVFDIKHGVAVVILAKLLLKINTSQTKGKSFRLDFKGSQQDKYQWLHLNKIGGGEWSLLNPRPDRYNFKIENLAIATEYESFLSISDLFNVNSTGFESGRDEILVAFTKEELRLQIQTFCNESPKVVKNKFNVSEGWGSVLYEARHGIIKDPDFNNRFRQFLFNPFDIRWCFYRKDILKTNSFSAGKHLCYGPNAALIVMRQVSLDSAFTHVGISKYIVNNRCFYSTKGKASYFPMYLYSGETDLIRQKGEWLGPNLRSDKLANFAHALHLNWANGDPKFITKADTMTLKDVMNYAYSVFYSEGYRARYNEFLKSDFPRLPLTYNLDLFRKLNILGGELIALHLMESLELDKHITKWIGSKKPEVENIIYSDNTVWIDKTQTQGFRGIPEAVWNVHIGGYQVLEKWLKDRKGRTLSIDDIAHYHKVVVALNETIRLMKEIDDVIEKHGGWPGAFVK